MHTSADGSEIAADGSENADGSANLQLQGLSWQCVHIPDNSAAIRDGLALGIGDLDRAVVGIGGGEEGRRSHTLGRGEACDLDRAVGHEACGLDRAVGRGEAEGTLSTRDGAGAVSTRDADARAGKTSSTRDADARADLL